MAKPSIVIASTIENGSSSMSTRSLNVPGSDSSALQTAKCGCAACAATADHFRPVGKAAPPRPTSFASLSSLITASAPMASAWWSAR